MAGLARPRSSEKTPARFSRWYGHAALLLIVLAAYANSFGLGLAQDSKVIAQDERLRAVTADNLKLILEKNYWWPKAGDGLYRPVTTLSLLFNYAVLGNGPNPTGYHVVNVLLHAINVWLLYSLALVIFRRAGPAFFAAAIWAVHPICTEAVTGIVGRADLLAAMAVLGGLLLYVRRPGGWTPVALFGIATLGVFAKENAAVLLGLMVLWDLSFGEGMKARWREYAAVAASLAVLVLVRHAVFSNLAPGELVYVDNPLRGAGFWVARWTAIKVVGLDLWLLLVPLALSCDRSFDQIPLSGPGDPWAWLSLLAIVAILAAAAISYRKDKLPFWLAGFFGIALLPTSNLIVVIGATVAERFLYLPSIAFAMAVGALLWRLSQRQRNVALGLLLLAYGLRTIARNPAWDNDLSLSSADVPTAPRSFRLHDMLAKSLYEKDARGNIDRIIQEQEASWNIVKPLAPEQSSAFPPTFLGVYYATKADFVNPAEKTLWYRKSLDVLLKAQEISRVLEKAYDQEQVKHGWPLTVRASNPQLYLHLADAYMNLGDPRSAVEALRYARGVNPRSLEAYDGLALAYASMGNVAAAVATMEEKALVDGFQPATLGAIHELYQKLPDGACAFVQAGNAQLNLAGCPRVKGDLCFAFGDLAAAYREARMPQDAAQVTTAATQTYGCQAR